MSIRRLFVVSAATLVAATSAGAALVARPAPAGATAAFSFTRLAGTDRFDTAGKAAEAAFPSGAPTVLLANGTLAHFPDALTASYLAGFAKAPILLTTTDTLPSATSQALQTLHTTSIAIIGGPAAVSDAQANQLKASFTVTRVYNQDGCTTTCTRYDTARSVAGLEPASYVGKNDAGSPTAVVASGLNFPDALVSGPLGYGAAFPVLITDPGTLSPQTSQTLQDLGIKTVLIPGGTAAVSSSVESQIQALGISTQRFSGQDRTDTAAQVASYALAHLGFSAATIDLARGDDPADSLAGAPFGGVSKTPLLLSNDPNTLGTYSAAYLTTHSSTLTGGAIFGGTSAVSQAVQDQATADAQTQTGPRFTKATAAVGSTTVVAGYNEAVNCSSVDPGDFAVTLAGSADAVTAAACPNGSSSGTTSTVVDITITTAPTNVSQSLVVTAQKGSDGDTVLDAAGVAQPAGDKTTATITPTTTPLLVTVTAGNTTTVYLQYNEAIACSSLDSNGSDYAVADGSTADNPTAAACSGTGTTSSSVKLTVPTAPKAGDTVTVTARNGADGGTVTDSQGATEPAGDAVSTTAIAPKFIGASVAPNSSTVTVVYNEAVACGSVDTLDYHASNNLVSGAACPGTATQSNTVNITLGQAVSPNSSVTITVNPSGSDGNTVLDPNGFSQASGDSVPATATMPPLFAGVTVTPGTTSAQVTYNEAILCSSVDPNGSDYAVTSAAAGQTTPTTYMVTGASCTGTSSGTVTITASPAFPSGQTVTVTAQAGTDKDTVKDSAGNTQPVGDHVSTSGGASSTTPSFTTLTQKTQDTFVATYNEAILTSTCDTTPAYDYSATTTSGSLGGSPQSLNITGVTCDDSGSYTPSGGTQQSNVGEAFITFSQPVPSGNTVTVTSQNGADGNTVCASGASTSCQATGQSVTSGAATNVAPAFTGATTSNGSDPAHPQATVTVTYNELVLCSTVDTNGSDYTVSYAPTGGGSSTNYPSTAFSAACVSPNSGGYSRQVMLTYTTTNAPFTAGYKITVTSKSGAPDNNTVCTNGPSALPPPLGTAQNCQLPPDSTSAPTPDSGQPPTITSVTLKSNPATPSALTPTTVEVTYNELITCSTVDADGTDYTVVANPSGGGSPIATPATAAACVNPVNGYSNTVDITVNNGPYQTGQTITVTAKKGTDTDTVLSPYSTAPEAVGDSKTSSAVQ